jgi:hypothetical protein
MSRNGARYDPVPLGTTETTSKISSVSRKRVAGGTPIKEKDTAKYHTVPLEHGRSPSYASLVSRGTAGSGPTQNEPALITSKWGIGWRIPTLMLLTYFLGMRTKSRDIILC